MGDVLTEAPSRENLEAFLCQAGCLLRRREDFSDDDDDLLLYDDAGDDLFLDSDDGVSISDNDDDLVGSPSQSTESGTANSRSRSNGLSRIRQYITWPVAAGLILVGLSVLGSSFKGPILDLLTHGDIEETRIHRVVAKMTDKVFSSVNNGQPYDLAWIESNIERVSESEYRVNAKIGVRLKEDLFLPLDDHYVFTMAPFSYSE